MGEKGPGGLINDREDRMRTVWNRLRLTAATAAIAGLLLAGCGGEASEAEEIASEFCDLIAVFEGLDEDDFDAMMEVMEELEGREDEFLALENRMIDSDLSDDEIEAAVRAECPDALDAFDGF